MTQFYISPPERQILISEIVAVVMPFDVPGTMKQLLSPHVDLQAQLPTGVLSIAGYIEAAIDISCNSGYALDPPVLIAFLKHLVDNGRFEADALLRPRLLTPQRAAAIAHPLEAELLYDRLAFNRSHLRQILRQMESEDGLKKILHVEGTKDSGRSWTSELIEFYCAKSGGRHLHCACSATEDRGSAAGPSEIAKDLATKLGAKSDACPPMLTNEDAYVTDLARWVISAANEPQPELQNNRRRVWFVFDGFGKGTLRDDTAKFLVELSRQCTSGVAARNHRVVFCELDFDLASRIRLRVQNYEVEPLSAADISRIVRSVIEANQKIPLADRDTLVEESVKMVVGDQPGPFVDLGEIGERLQEVIEESAG